MMMEVSAGVYHLVTTMNRLDKLVCGKLGLPAITIVVKEEFIKFAANGIEKIVPVAYESTVKKEITETTWFGLVTTRKKEVITGSFSESFHVYQPAVDKLLVSMAIQVSWAAHEVRHRLQECCEERISFGFWKKFRKSWEMSRFVGVSLFLYLTELVYCYRYHPDRRSVQGGEPDAYFITFLALADYENNSDLDRIAKIIQT